MRKAKVQSATCVASIVLETYLEGLRKCNKDSPDYPRLKELARKLRWSIEHGPVSKKRDPIKILPLEIQHFVFSHICYKQLISSTRVSPAWRASILSTRAIRTCVDVSSSNKRLTARQIEALFKKATTPERLVFYSIPKDDRRTMNVLLKCVLQSSSWIEIRIFRYKREPYKSPVPMLLHCQHEYLQPDVQVSTRCPIPMCAARTPWARNLKIIQDDSIITTSDLTRIFMSCPKLEHFDVAAISHGVYHFPPLDLVAFPRTPLISFKACFDPSREARLEDDNLAKSEPDPIVVRRRLWKHSLDV